MGLKSGGKRDFGLKLAGKRDFEAKISRETGFGAKIRRDSGMEDPPSPPLMNGPPGEDLVISSRQILKSSFYSSINYLAVINKMKHLFR